MIRKYKTIGVLGGMGPEASSSLYAKMIKYVQVEYYGVQDTDYPPIIIYSLPLFGFNETGIVDENMVKKQLIDGVRKLESAGCDLIALACNTVHIYYEEMQSAVNIPILNMIEETKNKVIGLKFKKVGLFASESTNKLNLYHKSFAESDIEIISANREQQKILNRVIMRIMGGNQSIDDIILLKVIARDYLNKGAEAITLGCTELPLAVNQTHFDIKLFDTIEIMAHVAVDYSLKKDDKFNRKNTLIKQKAYERRN